MITKYKIKKLLVKLGFSEKNGIFSKYIPDVDVYLRVDFNRHVFIYPEDKGLKIIERQICNLDLEDNLVIFECIHRLLEKGYKPHRIEIKSLSISNKSNNPIILVKNNDYESFLIIDCKTWGKKFSSTWEEIKCGNSDFFNYIHKEIKVKYFCLYTSVFENDELKYISYIIPAFDNDIIILSKEEDIKPELYKVRRHTYEYNYSTLGIFEPDAQPYQIVKSKYTLNNLRSVQEEELYSKYNEFYNIMLKYNISGRENAFDKLINLFICKIADEKFNQNDLQFYWKGNVFDSYFDLIDRLQLLYQKGMKEFFNEEIFYIDKDKLLDLFKFSSQDINVIKNKILEYFHFQKYFSNNNFNFLDVHNEKTFYKNVEVLSKIVEIFQDVRLTSDNHSQIIGDVFEFFLEKGSKQAKGQFFTPLPIIRFIILSLPMKTLFSDEQNPPKVIDYACGTGYFLTELAFQLRNILQKQDISSFYHHFYGIEKEYRLAKVAKVSACMYNQCEINIICGDALIQHPDVPENAFNLLIANPPYSVKGFLENLPESERLRYELIATIDPKSYSTNNAIEAFFLERAKQLLAPHGVAGIILPSSILSNTSGVYTRVREILLQNFDIIALVELGSGTFGKTGTNTVTLFLRRKDDNLAHAEYYRNLINTWFDGDTDKDGVFADEHLLQAYCDHIGIPIDDYRTLLQSKPNQTLLETEKFKEYRRAFDTSSEVKALQKQESFQQKSAAEQQTELDRRFIQFVREIEREKLYYFILAYTQPCPVIVVRSPQGTEEMKKFLGYEWSAAKGKEGIKYLRGSIENIETPLFDPKDRDNPEKISTIIRRNFEGQTVSIPESLKPYATIARLVDLLDFSRVSFDKQISLAPRIEVSTKYEQKALGDICDVIKGVTYNKNDEVDTPTKNAILTADNIALSGKLELRKIVYLKPEMVIDEEKRLRKSDIFICFSSGSLEHLGKVAFIDSDAPYYAGGFMGILRVKETNSLLPEYLYEVLNSDTYRDIVRRTGSGANIKNLSSTITEIKIPVPPLDIQAQIVAECQAIDAEVEEKEKKIIDIKNKIEEELKSIKGAYKKIKDVAIINPSKREIQDKDDSTIVSFVGMESVSNEGFIIKMEDKPLGELRKGSYTYFRENDIIIAKIAGSMENGKCALAQGLRNGIGMGSSEFHVLRAKQELIDPKFLFLMINREDVRKEAQKHFIGSSRKRVPASFYEDYEIIVPSLEKQKEVIDKVKKLEHELNKARNVISSAQERRRAVLRKYLANFT